ncbi:MAG: hypothetical protein A4E23_01857 [Methanomethylovorans sp. PtaU1.Bin073]|nr:MAG: hypothetical protein A4E23_01857 [Methanomethylovorans sp. PtaU1.Bin073]
MMKNRNSVFRDYVHELEDGSLSDVISDWKIEFMLHDSNFSVEELKHKVEEMGIEIIGDVEIEIGEWGCPDFVTISTDANIDNELYAELYEFTKRNSISVIFYEHQPSHSRIENGVETRPFYTKYRLDWIEMDVMLKFIKEDDPEEWARIQAENDS